jgi:hypothetical protein
MSDAWERHLRVDAGAVINTQNKFRTDSARTLFWTVGRNPHRNGMILSAFSDTCSGSNGANNAKESRMSFMNVM